MDFGDWLRRKLAEREINPNNLVEELNRLRKANERKYYHADITRWLGSGNPKLEDLRRVLEYFHADPSELFGGASGEKLSPAPAGDDGIDVIGRVAAGVISYSPEDHKRVPGNKRIWDYSAYRPLTQGPISYVEVIGDSMEPDFPEKSLIAVARPSTGQIPPLTPVIFRKDDEMTLKLFQRVDKIVLAIPVNKSHEVQHFPVDLVHIDYIALGVVNPWRTGVQTSGSQSRSLVLRSGKKAKPAS
jgi:SOS-response transcriptional repressor LexA